MCALWGKETKESFGSPGSPRCSSAADEQAYLSVRTKFTLTPFSFQVLFQICPWVTVTSVGWMFVSATHQQHPKSVSDKNGEKIKNKPKKKKMYPSRTKHNSTKPQGSPRPYFKGARGRIQLCILCLYLLCLLLVRNGLLDANELALSCLDCQTWCDCMLR